MRFSQTPLAGAYVIDVEPVADERGLFARTWCRREMEEHGLDAGLVQCSTSFNRRRGTLRGMHWQASPDEETKIVRCTRGAVYDVVLDLRPGSPTFKRWFAAELTADNRSALYVPAGIAHGFQTLADDSEVLYQMSQFHRPESARGVRWNDPAFAIEWPSAAERTMSERDRNWPDFHPTGGTA
jgi:dTDP-4-dehydrorhamnose 3,5-epimerase